MSPLSHLLAEAMPSWGLLLGPVVEHVAGILAAASPYPVNVPSAISGLKHRQAARLRADTERAEGAAAKAPVGPNVAKLPPRGKARQAPRVVPGGPVPLPACLGCGSSLPVAPDRKRSQRLWCPTCLPERRAAVSAGIVPASREHALDHQAARGTLPTHTATAQERRRETNRLRRLAELASQAERGELPDAAWCRDELVPRLASVSLVTIARTCGVSTSITSKWRRGIQMPSPRHWQALATIVGIERKLLEAPVAGNPLPVRPEADARFRPFDGLDDSAAVTRQHRDEIDTYEAAAAGPLPIASIARSTFLAQRTSECWAEEKAEARGRVRRALPHPCSTRALVELRA